MKLVSRKLGPRFLIGAVALIGLSLLIPNFQELPDEPSYVAVITVSLDASGKQLFIGTKENDYEFVLPPNSLGAAFATGECMLVFHGLRSDLAGNSTTSIEAVCGGTGPCTVVGADCYFRVLSSTLPEGARARLKDLGFSPANHYGATTPMGRLDPLEPPLYMVWQAEHVAGWQHPPVGRNIGDGRDLTSLSDSWIAIDVDDPTRFQRNHMINEILRPLAELKFVVIVPFVLLLQYFTGFKPGA
jgi:hypothetical protein